jgi:hypothetical protein
MATSREKFQLVFEAQEHASKKIAHLNKTLAAMGGPKLVKSQKAIKKLERDINSLTGTTKKSTGVFSKFTNGIAIGNLAATAVTKVIGLLTSGITALGDAIMVAANVEELAGVLTFVGQRAGYSTEQLKGYREELMKNGIAQKETNQALLRSIQGNIALSDAVKLGRIAQDAATIGQVNSSEAFQTLIDAVVKGRVVMLKSLGIQGTFQAEYRRLAKTLGKTQVELTEAEKRQARLNLVFAGGVTIAGAYDTAMGFASKQLRSMDRHIQNLQVTIGQGFTPSLGILTQELTTMIKGLNVAFKGDTGDDAVRLGETIGEITAGLVLGTKLAFNFGQVMWNVMEIMVIGPLDLAASAVAAFATALSDPFNLDAWSAAGDIISSSMDGLTGDWKDIKDAINDSEQAVIDFALQVGTIAINAQGLQEKVDAIIPTVDIPAMIEDDGEIAELLDEQMAMVAKSTLANVSQVRIGIDSMANHMKNSIGWAVGSMIENMVTGRHSMAEIFKGIAQDFMIFFIKTALNAVVTAFIPGLGKLLGGMFDTPVNDRMAANQGRDFMQWFTRGALAEAQGGSELAVGITRSSTRIDPVAQGGGGGGGMMMMNVYITGNVMSDEFIEGTVAPKIKQLASDGRTLLATTPEQVTGGRDVDVN